MQIHENVKREYMAAFARYEPIIMDSTAVQMFKKCPTLYFYQIVLGFVPKETEPYFAFGAAYHKFREELNRQFIEFNSSPGEAYMTALNIAKNHHIEFFPKLEPKNKFAFLDLKRLEDSCLVAFQHVLEERKKGAIEVIAYEQPFILDLDGTPIAGRTDEIVRWNGKLWGRDFKTSTKNTPFYSRGIEPNDQFTRYTWALSKLQGTKVEGIIVEALFNEPKKEPVIIPFLATRTTAQLERWAQEQEFWMMMMEYARQNDLYPMNENSCHFCKYHSVCKAPTESGKMSQLKSYYRVRPWDCTNVPND